MKMTNPSSIHKLNKFNYMLCRLLKVITKIEKLEPTLKTEKH